MAAVLVVAWLAWTIWPETGYVDPIYHRVTNPYVTVAGEVTGVTPAGAPLVVLGADWDPTLAYYSGRPTFMLTSHIATPEIIDRLPHEGYRYVVSMDSTNDPVQILSKWPWVGVLSAHVYVVGNHRSDVSDAPVYSSTAIVTPPAGAAPTTLACDAPGLALPAAGAQSELIVPADSEQVRISTRGDLAWLPPVGVIYSLARASCAATVRRRSTR